MPVPVPCLPARPVARRQPLPSWLHADSHPPHIQIWQRLGFYKNIKRGLKLKGRAARAARGASPPPVVGVLGCMAERLKHRLLESDRLVDLVAGPDAYRDLPRLIDIAAGSAATAQGGAGGGAAGGSTIRQFGGVGAINVQLSLDETYADVAPVRRAGATSAYLSIMRGCNNMCTFCIVPYVRGRERSRPLQSIVDEVRFWACWDALLDVLHCVVPARTCCACCAVMCAAPCRTAPCRPAPCRTAPCHTASASPYEPWRVTIHLLPRATPSRRAHL